MVNHSAMRTFVHVSQKLPPFSKLQKWLPLAHNVNKPNRHQYRQENKVNRRQIQRKTKSIIKNLTYLFG